MRIKMFFAMVCAVFAVAAVPSIAAAASPAPSAAPDANQLGKLPSANASARAAAGCNSAGPTVSDYRGIRFATRYCNNYRGGTVGFGSLDTGYLYAGRNWFVCQQRAGENPPVGNARNNIWLYTQGDKSYNATYRGWGWFPATYVSGGVNYGPIPGLRWC